MAVSIQVDTSGIDRMGNLMRAAGKQAPLAMVRAINHTGDKARTQMRRVLVKQTGLKATTINRAVKSKRAFGSGAYEIKSRGGNVRLMFFGARETRRGVSAAPWNQRKVYAGTFTKGGLFPNRVALNTGGAVLKRRGKGRFPLQTVKSGLFIPEEMVTGDSEAAFYETVQRELPARLAHELYRVL
ncbi:MAG TPA: phage tail protein [Xanthobacteraceae bacterium]|nr:phage tail protein [Xanthobacteraceae bacterium]